MLKYDFKMLSTGPTNLLLCKRLWDTFVGCLERESKRKGTIARKIEEGRIESIEYSNSGVKSKWPGIAGPDI